MKKAVLLCLALAVPAQGADLDPLKVPAFTAKRLDKLLFSDIARAGDSLVAVGDQGMIVRLEEGQWQQQVSPVSSLLTQVHFLDKDTGFVAGHDATLLKTEDGGRSWRIVYRNAPLQKPLMALHFFNASEGIAVGAYGLFLRTSDGGESWQKEVHEGFLKEDDLSYLQEIREDSEEDYQAELEAAQPHLNALAGQGDTLLLGGEMGLVALSTDKGQHWQRLDTGYPGSFFAVSVLDRDNWLVGGLRGHLFRTSDGGGHWTALRFDSQAAINGLDAGTGGSLLLTANNGNLYESHDGYLFLPKARSLGNATLAAEPQGQGTWVASDKGLHYLDNNNKDDR
ncbi:WD40/YVTN/BNR-like repeat-containing protein [Gallaecimonas xiamenensis]|uniref:BNR repeat-containing protein n=1 Tax=Gallaecimonas xiamenensis 3-C-1 TaxID=745411 RepID=K2JBP5_9GAMM|nr:YCF48-related protein [Gallaecimonas xiamenensis]EKE72182.1 BNR repeat-containing protein [Gallaecimonas xiamenensis 3-C-1]